MTATLHPDPPAGALVYAHPQGKRIYVLPDGSTQCWKADGKRATSSATPEKLAAGYGAWTLVAADDDYEPPAPQPEVKDEHPAGPRVPMTFGSAEVDSLAHLAYDDSVVLEQKIDGTRALVVIVGYGGGRTFVRFLGRNGQTLKHAAAAQHFARLTESLARLLPDGEAGEIVLDGEILTDTGILWLFDLPYMRVGGGVQWVTPGEPLTERRKYLRIVAHTLGEAGITNVRLLPQARTREEKVALINGVATSGAEGVMVKHVGSPYNAGQRVKHSLKVKFVRTADVVVTEVDRPDPQHGSFAFAVYGDDGELLPVGRASAIGKPDAKVGDVIEVRYLFRQEGGSLYQPTVLRLRPDRDPASCTLAQFTTYSKAVIA